MEATSIINQPETEEITGGGAMVESPQQPQALELGGMSGEVNKDMIKLPYLNLTQNTGEASELFDPGSYVFNQSIQIPDEADLQVTVIGGETGYQENLKYGESDDMPRCWPTAAAAKEAGMEQLEYGPNGEKPNALPYANFTVLLSVVDDLGGFTEGPDGRFYAVSKWFLGKSAFTSAGKPIVTANMTSLKDGCQKAPWKLATKRKSYNGNKYFVPLVRQMPRHSEATLEFFTEFLKPQN